MDGLGSYKREVQNLTSIKVDDFKVKSRRLIKIYEINLEVLGPIDRFQTNGHSILSMIDHFSSKDRSNPRN